MLTKNHHHHHPLEKQQQQQQQQNQKPLMKQKHLFTKHCKVIFFIVSLVLGITNWLEFVIKVPIEVSLVFNLQRNQRLKSLSNCWSLWIQHLILLINFRIRFSLFAAFFFYYFSYLFIFILNFGFLLFSLVFLWKW